MAPKIIIRRPRGPEPPPKPRTTFGIDRRPETKPPDIDKLLTAGTELAKSAETYVYRACDLFSRLDHFARVNRANLTDPDVLEVLAGRRVEAEGWLERGFHAFDSALRALTRLVRHEPPAFADEGPDRESRARRKTYFLALGQVVGSVFARIYEVFLATPTCGELSAIPPWVYVDEPDIAMRQRYDRRYDMCRTTGHFAAAEYWRRRNLRAVESRELEGEIMIAQPSPDGGGGGGGGGPGFILADDGRGAEQQLLGEAGMGKKPKEPARRKSQRVSIRTEKAEGTPKRKRGEDEAESPYSPPRWKKRTRPFVLKVGPEEGQDMGPLTNKELAQLPWNAKLKRTPPDDKGKVVVPHRGSAWWDMAKFPHLLAWSRLEKPPVDFGWKSDGDDSDSEETGASVSHVDLSTEPASGDMGSAGQGRSDPPAANLSTEPASGGTGSAGQGQSDPAADSAPAPTPARRHGSGSPSTGASKAPHNSMLEDTTMQLIDNPPIPPGFSSVIPAAEAPRTPPPDPSTAAITSSGEDYQTVSDVLAEQVHGQPPGATESPTAPPGGTGHGTDATSSSPAPAIPSNLDDDTDEPDDTQESDDHEDSSPIPDRSDDTWLQMSNQQPYQATDTSYNEDELDGEVWRV